MKDNNFIKKLILAAAAFIAQILIVMIIIFILLNKNIINVLTAFVLITVVFAIFVVLILNILRSIVVLLRGAIAGTASSDDKTAEKIKKVSARNDEVGEIVRNVTVAFEGITGTVAAIRNATVELEQVSEEFVAMFDTMHTVADSTNAAVTTITDNTTVQADKVADIKVKTDSISKAVDNIQTNIEGLKESIDTLNECNNRAADIMKELITISEESGHAMDEVSNETERTNASAQEIRKVTEIIAGISNQTNLLALNASIEAARAGEAGRGFSVVATEISGMATQTKEATVHITELIENISNAISEVVSVVREMIGAINEEKQSTENTANNFSDIQSNTLDIQSNMEQLNSNIEELKTANEQIVHSIETISAISEEVSAHANETMSAQEDNSDVLNKITDRMQQLIELTKQEA